MISSHSTGAEPTLAGPRVPFGRARVGRRPLTSLGPIALAALATLLTLAGCGGGGGDGGGDDDDAGGSGGPIVDVTPPAVPLPAARGLLPSLSLAEHAFEGEHFAGSGACAACHNNPDSENVEQPMTVYDDSGARDVSIGTAWETSTMANAARDPYWHAVVAYELDRYPGHADDINDKCTRCHAPMANEYAKKEGIAFSILDTGSEADGTFEPGLLSMDMDDPLFNHAMDGVSCTLCHQIDADNLGIGGSMPESSMSGGFRIVDYTGLGEEGLKDRPAYGQYAGQDGPVLENGAYMRQQVGFSAQYGAHISQSETCSTCHNLNVEPLDKDGEAVGGEHFAEQANYTEWLFSDYATGGPLEQSCQDCHMPTLDQNVVIASNSEANQRRPDFAEHVFLGANTVMQTMMRDNAAALGIMPGLDFDASIDRNRAFLATAATLELQNAAKGAVTDEARRELAFDVEVTNESGHKLPSGYHSRRVWLHVEILDEDGAQVFESGRIEPDGRIVGVSEDVDPDLIEPHHDVITSAAQVQVYQAVVGNSDDERTQSLLNGNHYLKDNRLTPKGFLKANVNGNPSVPESFGVFGEALADENFDDGVDLVSYRLSVPEADAYTVRVELRYQPLSYGHLGELFLDSERLDEVDRFRTIYDNTELKHETIASVTLDID